MAVVLLALGSRGDVQPLAGLAGALHRRGVDVAVAALGEYADVVVGQGAGVRFIPLPGRLADALGAGQRDRHLTRTQAGQWLVLRRWVAGMASGLVDSLTAAVGTGDVVLTGVLTRGVAAALAEARGCRVATVVYTGQVPTVERESFYSAGYLTGCRAYDAWGVRFNWQLATSTGGPLTRATRQRLGLPRLSARGVLRDADRHPTIVAASPLLVPPASDWADGVHQTGYLAPAPTPFTPDADLAAFLADGRAVYLGFGSLTRFASREDFAVLLEAAQRAGRPVVTPAPHGAEPGEMAPGIFAIGAVPHSWLFPRLAGTVHHGGAGTTHEALRSGVPSVVVPFGVDQPYHAERLHRLGVGPAPLPRRRLTASRLAHLVRELVDSPRSAGYRRRAGELAAVARAEDGVGRTITVLRELGLLSGKGRPDGSVAT